MYKYALTNFEKAISLLPSDGEAYYYAAISMLSGKRPFLSSLTVVKKATEYIDLAMELSDNGIYLYLKSLIYSDYYENKHLKCYPSSSELRALAMKSGVNEIEANDVKHLVGLL
jgi:tetratricopeptide (TPR) repeat protein